MMDTKEMERLSKSMADFMGMKVDESQKPSCGQGAVWIWDERPNCSFESPWLIEYFFDPDGSPKPNPRGFQPVLDKLDEVYGFPSITYWVFDGTKRCAIATNPKRDDRLDAKMTSAGEGPNRPFALYSAIDKLKGEG